VIRRSAIISRRHFLVTAATSAATTIVAACGSARPSSSILTPEPARGVTATISTSAVAAVTPLPPSAPSLVTPATVSLSPAALPAPSDVIVWLRDHGIPFATVEPGDDFSDLQPLKQIIGDARIVSVGEATHGTHEFQAMKDRLVRFLVTKMGFTDFAMEANLPECERVNDYVHTGQGDLPQLLRGLYFWTWNTEEVRDMVNWMRAHNASPAGTPCISFHGFDMQSISVAMGDVLTYLQQVDPPAATNADARYMDLPGRFIANQDAVMRLRGGSAADRSAFLAGVQNVYDNLATMRNRYTAASTSGAYARTVRDARIAVQGAEYVAADPAKQNDVRDRYMAENVTWLLDRAGPNAKIILWAHNQHVGTTPYDTVKSMGMWLREQYGDAMRVIGQTFYAGACNAVEGMVTEVVVPPPLPDSYEAAFHGTGYPRAIVDLRAVHAGTTATNWLEGPHPSRAIGAGYDEAAPEKFFNETRLPEKFDALIYIQDSTATRLLPGIG